jgi:DNA sulfur modification protein DndC
MTKEQPHSDSTRHNYSAFNESGFKATIQHLYEEIREFYISDDMPWIIGYSGGKDSTATLQLVWEAIADLPSEKCQKCIYIITTDTLVENPVVAQWVNASHSFMTLAADRKSLPFKPLLLKPLVDESFWVNLIGRGYPAPRHKFRWCTDRLKIQPSNRFISHVVSENGQAILCLGARKHESLARARVLERAARSRVRERLSPSDTLPGCMIYTPIESWTNDDVWFYLNNNKNPWGVNNKELMGMYAGASADGECPLVVDTSTPSCGNSRFGCWVCTLVEKDKSMTAMIQNDVEKEWLMPLLDLRNELDFRNNINEAGEASDHHLRDFRRMSGAVQIMTSGKSVPGPYTQEVRKIWLTKLLSAQTYIRQKGPAEVHEIELIGLDELQEIRRIWVVDKHELEDSLPRIYKEATGEEYPGKPLDDNMVIGELEMQDLEDVCQGDRFHYELIRELLSVTAQQRVTSRRAGIFDQLEKSFVRHFYDDREDALARAQKIMNERKQQEKEAIFRKESRAAEETTIVEMDV